ncbi:MAG: deoxyribonuclease IV [Epsilonproteobacteria bacterium]|nr:deoxyribonuclease IV [Campylobacterota bacterium]NPA56427.1 deoxyribonuclease IV [Campylobacterota bacterium]
MAKFVGAHVSAAGGVQKAPLNAAAIGARAFAFFTKNQRQWKAKPLKREEIEDFQRNLQKVGIDPDHVLPHDSYLINLGHPEEEKRRRSLEAFIEEIHRVKELGLKKLNFHPGSHLRQIGEREALQLVAQSMNEALKESEGVTLVIENTAGQGSNLGYRFDHLAYLIEESIDESRVGVCLDTAHLFGAGYDIRDRESYEATMEEFGRVVGFSHLEGMHLNDSKVPLNSRKDRHHSLGRGYIGLEAFRFIMQDPRLDGIPLILETIDPSLWREEIELLYAMMEE